MASALETVRANSTAILAATAGLSTVAAVYFWAESRGGLMKALKNSIGGALASLPGVSGVVDAEMAKVLDGLKHDLLGDVKDEERIKAMPAKGLSKDEVIARLKAADAKDRARWSCGRLSGSIYHGGDDLSEIISEAFSRFSLSNPLHPDSFPSVRQMEAEIVAMTLSLFNPTPTACGTTTSGGTESILLAAKAFRDWGRRVRGITEPEMVIPTTAHAAFDKAAHYFGIKLIKVPVNPTTFRADVEAMAARVNRNTVMLVGSAPSFSQGVVDPIPELSALAVRHGIPLHVDCCLGSFMMPLAHSIGGRTVPDFDFKNEGVVSISCDTHKFGFTPKGSSVIMYRSPEWRKYQFFSSVDWTGGIYATPTIAGSRAGANLVATWAVLMHHGREGYEAAARKIFAAADRIAEGVKAIPQLEIYGSVDHSIVAFGSPRSGPHAGSINIYKLSSAMSSRGWSLNPLQNPPSMHICVTYANSGNADAFVDDLNASVREVLEHPDKFTGGAAAMYGSATAMAPDGLKEDMANAFWDVFYMA